MRQNQMLVKTSELSGNALCYAVTMIRMPHLVWGVSIGLHYASNQVVVLELPEPQCYSPFTGWDMIGPIIEQEKIGTIWIGEEWQAQSYLFKGTGRGPTPLIAAMRCLLAIQLRSEVEIPDELLK
jgi:hypothetical protein